MPKTMLAHLDVAVTNICDGVDPNNIDAYVGLRIRIFAPVAL